MAWPQTLPLPGSTFMTPSGMPAMYESSANLSAVSGETYMMGGIKYTCMHTFHLSVYLALRFLREVIYFHASRVPVQV